MPRNPSLRHVYANVAEFNDYLVTGGSAALTNASNNAIKLAILEEVSRLIDARAHRGSGFGPWVGTKSYDGDGKATLYLRADLDELDSISVKTSATADATSPVVDDDFYLGGLGSYEPPFRRIIFHGQGTPTLFGTGIKLTSISGTWSYPYRTVVLTETVAQELNDSDTECDVSGLTGISAGMTLLIDDEQVYVSATTADDMQDTITIERGVNGTTAAEHADESAVLRYLYDPSVHALALRLAEKRLKARDSGADGTDGGGDVGTISLKEGEDTIIRRMIGATVMLSGQV